jgi:hypothetical protein
MAELGAVSDQVARLERELAQAQGKVSDLVHVSSNISRICNGQGPIGKVSPMVATVQTLAELAREGVHWRSIAEDFANVRYMDVSSPGLRKGTQCVDRVVVSDDLLDQAAERFMAAKAGDNDPVQPKVPRSKTCPPQIARDRDRWRKIAEDLFACGSVATVPAALSARYWAAYEGKPEPIAQDSNGEPPATQAPQVLVGDVSYAQAAPERPIEPGDVVCLRSDFKGESRIEMTVLRCYVSGAEVPARMAAVSWNAAGVMHSDVIPVAALRRIA